MSNSPIAIRTDFPGKSIQIELWQRSDARFAALVRERADSSHTRFAHLQAKLIVLRQFSNVHVESFGENDSECTLEYSVLLTVASLDEARDELCCILLVLEAEADRLFLRSLSA